MAYRFVQFPMALNELKVIRLLWDLSNAIRRTLYDISHGSTDTARRAVPRR